MVMKDTHAVHPPQAIHCIHDKQSGLEGVIVIHSVRLGPAAGGCRFWQYDSYRDMTEDAVRLAQGMAYKNAMAGLPSGGSKAVINKPAELKDRGALFRAFGRAVNELAGRYVTAEDVGTSVEDMIRAASCTRYVAGLAPHSGSACRPSLQHGPHRTGTLNPAVDARICQRLLGDIFVAEISYSAWKWDFPSEPPLHNSEATQALAAVVSAVCSQRRSEHPN